MINQTIFYQTAILLDPSVDVFPSGLRLAPFISPSARGSEFFDAAVLLSLNCKVLQHGDWEAFPEIQSFFWWCRGKSADVVLTHSHGSLG